jgi:hypothetical protein
MGAIIDAPFAGCLLSEQGAMMSVLHKRGMNIL